MTESEKGGFVFKSVVVCETPMEAEIYPATLREQEIPHRTEWNPGGSLTILVPEEWEEQAKGALAKAAQVFFGEGNVQEKKEAGEDEDQDEVDPVANQGPQGNRGDQEPEEGAEGQEEAEEIADEFGEAVGMFGRGEGLPSPEEMQIRKVWPAWALAALPGTGLGHLYAGKFQMFLYLAFLSVLGVLFFQFTKSYLSFAMNLFSWTMDLGFAAYHVKEHNRRAERARKAADEAEKKFLRSMR